MSRVYVASSWRNKDQPIVVQALRRNGHEVYDFKDPEDNGGTGFHWSDLDENWENWSPDEYRRQLLNSPVAAHGYLRDMRGMEWADTCVLVLPCGRSAHLEAGWFKGRGKRLIVLLEDMEPELMALMADRLCLSIAEVLRELTDGQRGLQERAARA
tara:strand:+ start:434 stop:901 length:468 start_codon:yes stop_codon:yes gene_type:complete